MENSNSLLLSRIKDFKDDLKTAIEELKEMISIETSEMEKRGENILS